MRKWSLEINDKIKIKYSLGRLWFSVQYNPETERLVVKLIQIKNLRSRIPGTPNACDPFVKLVVWWVDDCVGVVVWWCCGVVVWWCGGVVG